MNNTQAASIATNKKGRNAALPKTQTEKRGIHCDLCRRPVKKCGCEDPVFFGKRFSHPEDYKGRIARCVICGSAENPIHPTGTIAGEEIFRCTYNCGAGPIVRKRHPVLSEAQRDGRACVSCATEGGAMVPVGEIYDCQVFQCLGCRGESQGAENVPEIEGQKGEPTIGERIVRLMGERPELRAPIMELLETSESRKGVTR